MGDFRNIVVAPVAFSAQLFSSKVINFITGDLIKVLYCW